MQKQPKSNRPYIRGGKTNAEINPHCDSLFHTEVYEEKKEMRQLRHWLIKVCVLSFVSISALVVLTLCYAVLFHESGLQQEFVVAFGSFAEAIISLVKFLAT
jgi:hypothetical protein